MILALLMTGLTVMPTLAQEDGGDTACQNEVELIASLLGVDEDTVQEARRNGTLDDLAAENDVEVSALAEAIVDNRIACDNEVRQNMLPEEVCATLEGGHNHPFVIQFDMNPMDWTGAAAEALGLSVGELLNRTGSLASLAEQQGVEVQTLIDSIVEEASRMIYQQNQAGFLSDEEASQRLETLAEDVADYVNQTPQNPTSVLEAARETLGLSVPDFYQALIDGKTLAEIASENGVSEADLLNAVVEAATVNIENARTMGWMSDCVADVRLNRLQETATSYLNRENPDDMLFGSPFQMVNVESIMPHFFAGELPFQFEMRPDGFHFGDGDMQFEIRPGEFFGDLNFGCDALETFEAGKIDIGPRGEIQIVTPDGMFTLQGLLESCLEMDEE